MIKNRIHKILVIMIIAVMASIIIGPTAILAAKKTENKTFSLSSTRKVKNSNGEYIDKGQYKLNTGSDYPIFQIISLNGTTITGTDYYCLKAKLGDTWGDPNNSAGERITANTSYDLAEDKTEIGALPNTNYANIATNNFGPVLWILDNMYTEGGITTTQLLNNAGIEYGPNPVYPTLTDWHYNSEERVWQYGYSGYTVDGEDVIIDVAAIQAVQQAAIWHFTNAGDSEFDFNIAEGSANAGYQFKIEESNATKKAMKQEQMAILYNYFVNNAKTKTSYKGNAKGKIELKYTTSKKIEEVGDDYRIGPLKATTTGTVTDLNIQITPATGAKVTNANGEEKTFKANEEFYVTIPASSVTSDVKINVTGKTVVTEKKLWLVIDGQDLEKTEQPIVEPKTTELPLSDQQTATPSKQFDLALRKRIVAINGKSTDNDIINEAGNPAQRAMDSVTTDSIPDTAVYKHRKDPVVVKTNDIVTYRIWIYNEGDINGYASKIVDQLPTGITSTLGDTITSNKGTTYNVSYDETNNKITLTAVGATAKTINKWNGTTLSSDYVDVTCKVNQTSATDGTTKHYLTNIAYIAEGYDTENSKVVTEDRSGNESKTTESPTQTASQLNSTDANSYKGKSSNPSVYNDTDNQTYFQGQQDDDDFEKVVVLPKQFDLALRKFITKINNQNITDRVPVIGTWKYDNNQTLEKSHPKTKLSVQKGDTVIYTIRVYNEGDVDGYAAEVTDYLPAGLSLKQDSETNTQYGWTANGQTIKTTYLSKTNGTDRLIKAFDGTKEGSTGLSYKDLLVECVINENATSENLKNIAAITEATDSEGNEVTDRDSQPENINTNTYNPTNPDKGRGEQDDDDFEDLKLAEFDLALRKFITKISTDGNFEDTNTTSTYNRAPQVDSSKLKAGTAKTATYNHSKEPILLNAGDYVEYTIRVYNEGDIDGYASQIIDYLPENLDFVESTDSYIKAINDKWTYDSKTRKVTTKADAQNATTKLSAFDAQNDNGNGSGLSYVDVKIVCRVNKKAVSNKKLTNIAEISEYKNEDGDIVPKDRDSNSNNLDYPDEPSTYKDDEINKQYVPGQQDDDDFEKVIVKERKVDLALTKFITAVSVDDKIENGEYLTPNKNIGSKTNEYIRATVADTTGLKNGTSTNATYTAKKNIEPLTVSKNSYILYNIRVYNEGEVDVYAGKITDYLPENLEFVDGDFNKGYGWTANGQTVETTYLSYANGNDKLLKAFDKENDDGKGSGLDYKDLPVLCKVSDKAESGKKMVNTAEITKYEDEDGNELPKDIDSTPDNKEEKNVEERDEDDDDYEVVIIKDFDLALRKFITEIDTVNAKQNKTTAVTNFGREPKLSYENGKIIYTHPKDVVRTTVDSVVTYTLRVFNEGDIAGYAEEISDDMPEYLEFLPEHATNREYKWVMYDKDGKSTTKVDEAVKITTDYTSKANGELLMKANTKLTENPNLLNAFDKALGITDKNPDYVDVKVAFKVKDPNSNKTVIVNKAQISEDADEDGNPVEDIDSIPDKWNDGEDDQDYENVAVDYFDLSLLKYVTKAIVTENGKTKTTKTGNNGSKNDITPKVEVYRKRLNKTIVKFEFTIKITNEGDIAGYAKEITDYVPKGLKFYKEDNKGWKDEGNNVISTKLLKDTLLQPGQSATVKVILRWINGENNLGLKTNVAEISEDYNEKGVPDRDSTPDNKKKGEDDIDDAPVLLTISTGMLEHTIQYATVAVVILIILGAGLAVIKKYVL